MSSLVNDLNQIRGVSEARWAIIGAEVDEECPTGSFDAKQLPVLELYSIRDGGEEKSNEKMLTDH